jgi:hypothetical protein
MRSWRGDGGAVSAARSRVEVMHGVNLDMLGRRDPAHYGTLTLPELERQIGDFARELELEVRCFQTNSEREFIEHLHGINGSADGLLLNPGPGPTMRGRSAMRSRSPRCRPSRSTSRAWSRVSSGAAFR